MPTCAVAGCNNHYSKTKGTDIKYYSFPKNDDLQTQWINACGREDKFDTKNAYLLSNSVYWKKLIMDSCSMNKGLEEFLTARRISEETIQLLKSEKIDIQVLALMEENQLSAYISSYGDRIAIIDYAKRKFNRKRLGLVEKLRYKIGRNRKGSKCPKEDESSDESENKVEQIDQSRKSYLTLKKNGVKDTRLVLIGWITSALNEDNFKQVRLRQGGGTRRLSVKKSDTVEEIRNKAIDVFFPNGISRVGHKNSFSFELRDFQRDNIDDCTLTIEQMYALTKVTNLRFYLASRKKEQTAAAVIERQEGSIIEIISISSEIKTTDEVTINQPETVVIEPETVVIEPEIVVIEPETVVIEPSVEFSVASYYEAFSDVDALSLNNETFYSSNVQLEVSSLLDNNDVGETFTNSELNKNVEPLKLSLHRGQCFKELLEIYQNVKLDETNVVFVDMLLPNGEKEVGVDTGGIFRDALTEFWREFYEKCTVGTNYKIPIIRHDFGAEKWTTVAKILLKGWRQEKMFPLKLAPVFIKCCVYGDIHYDEFQIIDDFIKYLGPGDGQIIKSSLDNFDAVDMEDLLSVLEVFQCKWAPSRENIHTLIADIAHTELIQKPMFIINRWMPILKDIVKKDLLETMYLNNAPTSKNILKHLKYSDHLSSDEIEIISYLKRFIKESDENTLVNFLRFCTGCDMITDNINIEFNATAGTSRTPIGHTCGRTLQLSITYDNYPDFRFELNSVLQSNIWVMDFV